MPEFKIPSSDKSLTAGLPVPLPSFHVAASEVNNDQDRIVIVIGFADRRRGLVDEFSGAAVDGKDLDLGVAAVPHVFK